MTYNDLKTLICYMHKLGINTFSELCVIALDANIKTNDDLLIFAEELYDNKRTEEIFN